jgi:hypothetical protein
MQQKGLVLEWDYRRNQFGKKKKKNWKRNWERRKEGERKRAAYGTCRVASNKYQPLDFI